MIETIRDYLGVFYAPAVAAVAVAVVLLAYWIGLTVLRRAAAHSPMAADDILVRSLARPGRWLLVSITLVALLPILSLSPQFVAGAHRVFGLLIPAQVGWLVIALLRAGRDIVARRADISIADNLQARRQRTRVDILYRIGVFVVLLIALCMMLMSIPSVRNIGVTLIASAGLAGLAVGAAAQPALKNLIAGVQMAFTEPIRIDDVVILDNEFGRIEEIGLTYVVVRVWDDRRLVVPVSRFLETTFQNWTRESSELLGTIFLHVDLTADVPRIRAKVEEVVKANPNWDGRAVGLQVIEAHATHMTLRAVVSAIDAGSAFQLRCDVREAMTRFLADEMPEALPRRRAELTGVAAPADAQAIAGDLGSPG